MISCSTLSRLLVRVGACAALVVLAAAPTPAQSDNARQQPWSPEILELFESLPVQDGGRVKPLHTHAAFLLLRINGKRSLETPAEERLKPVAWFLDVLFFPEAAADYQIFLVQNSEVVQAIGITGLDKKERDRYSLNELRPGVEELSRLASEYVHIEKKNRTTVQQQLVLLANNVREYLYLAGHLDYARAHVPLPPLAEFEQLFAGKRTAHVSEIVAQMDPLLAARQQMITAGRDKVDVQALAEVMIQASDLLGQTSSLAMIPPPLENAVNAPWRTPSDQFYIAFTQRKAPEDSVRILRGFEVLASVRNQGDAFERELRELHGFLTGSAEARGEYDKIGLEVTYYKAKLLDYSQYGYVLAFLLTAFLWLRPRNKLLYRGTSVAALVSAGLLIGAITLRCVIRGRPPVSTLYETVLFVTAVASILGLCIEAMNKRRIALSAVAVFGTLGVFIANGFEVLDKRDTMPSLVAVLDTNFWLATHVTAITIGYSAGMLAALLASTYLLGKAFRWRRDDRSFYPSLGKMVYGVLCFALIFSTVGTILGGIWANDSWGRFWGWDPKENGALLIVLSQLVILHARMGGYLRTHGVCMATAFAGTVIAFSWWGVNLLGVGLHSYGFTEGISAALWTYYYIQWGIVGVGGLVWLRDRAPASRPAAVETGAAVAQPARSDPEA